MIPQTYVSYSYRDKQITVPAEIFNSTHSKLGEEYVHYRKLPSKLFACQNHKLPKLGFLQVRVLGKLLGVGVGCCYQL